MWRSVYINGAEDKFAITRKGTFPAFWTKSLNGIEWQVADVVCACSQGRACSQWTSAAPATTLAVMLGRNTLISVAAFRLCNATGVAARITKTERTFFHSWVGGGGLWSRQSDRKEVPYPRTVPGHDVPYLPSPTTKTTLFFEFF